MLIHFIGLEVLKFRRLDSEGERSVVVDYKKGIV